MLKSAKAGDNPRNAKPSNGLAGYGRDQQSQPDQQASWTPRTVADSRRCAVRGAMPLIGVQEALLRAGLEASDAETAEIGA